LFEAVGLDVVQPLVNEHVAHLAQVRGIALGVGRHHADHVHVPRHRLFQTPHHAVTDAPVALVVQHGDPGVLMAQLLQDLERAVLAAVVHDDDQIHEVRHGLDRLGDQLLLVVGRDRHGHAAAAVHGITPV
jgi:hypothetical protein